MNVIEHSLTSPELSVRLTDALLDLEILQPVELATRAAVNGLPTATLILSLADHTQPESVQFDRDLKLCRPGATISIRANDTELFVGQVVSCDVAWKNSRPVLTLLLAHRLSSLSRVPKSSVFHEALDEEIVSEMLAVHEIPFEGVTTLSTFHQQLVQFREPDLAFIMARARSNAAWMVPTTFGVNFVTPYVSETPDHMVSRTAETQQEIAVEEIQWSFTRQSSSLELQVWNVETQETISAIAREPNLGLGALDSKKLVLETDSQDESVGWSCGYSNAQTEGLANGSLLGQRASGAQCRLTILGSTKIGLGETLSLKGFGIELDGSGLVMGIDHSIRKGMWRTEISIGQRYDRSADPAFASPGATIVVGVIDELLPDPDELERIAVKLISWPGTPSVYARWSTPYASKENGMCLYPSAGDEVVLAFFESNPSYPVIVGSMFSPINLPPIPQSPELPTRGLVIGGLEAGMRLVMSEDGNSVSIGTGANALLLDEGAVSIEAADADVSVEAAAIQLTADSIDLDAS